MDATRALDLAQRMSMLDNYPRSDKAIGQIGEMIYGLCKTDEQLDWLRNELLSGKYSKWQGPGWLKDIFTSRFPISEKNQEHHYQATDCPYCGGSGWYVSRQVGLYDGVSRCDHHGITPKPLPVDRACPTCKGWGTIRDKAGLHQFCLCSAGQALRDLNPKWLELLSRFSKNDAPRMMERTVRTIKAGHSIERLEGRYYEASR